MRNQLPCIKMLIGLATGAMAFTLGTATAKEGDRSMFKVGTVMTMEGVELINNQWVPYEQYMKCSGTVIVPETQANMYYLFEMWGRDTEIIIMRQTPKGDGLIYSLGNESKIFINGPVGTSWEWMYLGGVMRGEIVGDGITLTLPTGETYSDLVIMNLYCLSCAEEPVLQETHWVSREIGWGVLIAQWGENPFWEWLVSIIRK